MRVNDLDFQYPNQAQMFEGLTVSFNSNEITTIVGPNGSGKSTLLHLLSHNLKPTKGTVYLDQQVLSSYSKKALAKKLATVHQKSTAPEDFTVRDVIACGRYSYQSMFKPDTDCDTVVTRVMKQLDLLHYADTPIASLSGGEMQRVYIAMSLAQEPKYMLLDEPTTFLDLHYQYQVLDIVQSLKLDHHMTIIMVLHDINQALAYSDQIICMRDGRILAQGKPSEVITESLIKDVYQIDAKIIEDDECGMMILKKKEGRINEMGN